MFINVIQIYKYIKQKNYFLIDIYLVLKLHL